MNSQFKYLAYKYRLISPEEHCSTRHNLSNWVGHLNSELEEEGGGHLGDILTQDQEGRHPDLEPCEAADWDHLGTKLFTIRLS